MSDRVNTLTLAVSAALLLTGAAAQVALADSTPLEARLLEVKGDTVKLNKGGRQGVSVGQIFDLYEEARVYLLPLTNGDKPLVKSHRRVARVQVVQVEPTTAEARVISREEGDDGHVLEVEPAQVKALHNPAAVAPNRRPAFVHVPKLQPVAWGETVPVELRVSNESDDDVVYTWSVTGGRLAHQRTLLPSNAWTAPAAAGDYQLSVTALDSAGNVTRVALRLTSSGMDAAKTPSRYVVGRTYGPTSRYGTVSDLAFDALGRRYFLNPKRGWGGEPYLRVELPSGRILRLPTEGRAFTALAVSDPSDVPGALLALDGDSKTVLHYRFGGVGWNQVLKRDPLVLGREGGGSGNARFEDPVDVVSRGGEIYVLDAGQRSVQVFTVQTLPGKKEQGVFLVSFGRPGDEPLQLQRPRALAVARDGTVYVLDDGRKAVVVYRDWRPVDEFSVGGPEEELGGLSVDPYSGDVYVLVRSAGTVKRFDRGGTLIGKLGETGGPAALYRPVRMRMDATRVLWVLDREGESVVRFDHEGRFLGRTGGIELSGYLQVAGQPSGGAAVLERDEYRVTCFDEDGWITARFGAEGTKPGQFEDPIDLAVTATGDVLVLDAERKAVQLFSPSGAFLRKIGQPGAGARDLMGVMDLTVVNDRSYFAVLQQRPEENFNLFHPGRGVSERTWGQFTGELTPRYGCVTGVTGSLGSPGRRESDQPWYWTVDEDREKVFRSRPGEPIEAVKLEFDTITDIECSVQGLVFVVDRGDDQIVVLDPRGAVLTTLKGDAFEDPVDVGVDDFGRLYVYDRSSRRVVQLVPRD